MPLFYSSSESLAAYGFEKSLSASVYRSGNGSLVDPEDLGYLRDSHAALIIQHYITFLRLRQIIFKAFFQQQGSGFGYQLMLGGGKLLGRLFGGVVGHDIYKFGKAYSWTHEASTSVFLAARLGVRGFSSR